MDILWFNDRMAFEVDHKDLVDIRSLMMKQIEIMFVVLPSYC